LGWQGINFQTQVPKNLTLAGLFPIFQIFFPRPLLGLKGLQPSGGDRKFPNWQLSKLEGQTWLALPFKKGLLPIKSHIFLLKPNLWFQITYITNFKLLY